MKKVLILSIALLMLVAMSGTVPAASLDLSFGVIGDPVANPLDPFVVEIFAQSVDDIGDTTLQGMGFDLQYDSALLNVTGANVAPSWSLPIAPNFATDGSVTMGAGVFPAIDTASGPLKLGDITFVFEAIGTSSLTIFEYPVSGLANFTSGPGQDLDFLLAGGDVIGQISNVPIPGSILLLGSGLVGLIGMARRKRS